jgi:hypothetical protein
MNGFGATFLSEFPLAHGSGMLLQGNQADCLTD